MSEMDINQILEILPHRYPFLLVDRVLDLVPNERIRVLKNVTANEPCFTGHFPEYPVMPGVLILESMAQASAMLAVKTREALQGVAPDKGSEVCYFAGIDNARFKRPVLPGDSLIIESQITKVKSAIWKCHARATVDGVVACEADLMAALRKRES